MDHSTEGHSTEEVNEETDASNPDTDAQNGADEQDELAKLREENSALNDKFLRLYSEFENFRRRTAKEKVEMMSSASGKTIEKILPVLDDLDRASTNNQQATDVESVKQGFELIEQKMRNILTGLGVTPMEAKGKVFDTDHHEAISKIPAPEEDLKGKVVDVVESGYFLNEKVLRYAKVVVGE